MTLGFSPQNELLFLRQISKARSVTSKELTQQPRNEMHLMVSSLRLHRMPLKSTAKKNRIETVHAGRLRIVLINRKGRTSQRMTKLPQTDVWRER